MRDIQEIENQQVEDRTRALFSRLGDRLGFFEATNGERNVLNSELIERIRGDN